VSRQSGDASAEASAGRPVICSTSGMAIAGASAMHTLILDGAAK
jgi:hypothetical protein